MRIERHGSGYPILNFHGQPEFVAGQMEALVIFDDNALPFGYLLYELHQPETGPRPWYRSEYLFLYSAWVCEKERGQGVFTRMTARLRRLHPSVPIVGMPVDKTGALERFFARCARMPGRAPVAR
jgi:hypothetical protein